VTPYKDKASPLQFPCRIDVKAMGKHENEFVDVVLEIVQRHVPDVTREAVTTRLSSAGNYISVSVAVRAQSREQMDALYRELSAHERVSVAL
jgi:hypothetical protein